MVIIGAGERQPRRAGVREVGFGGPVTLIGTELYVPNERLPLSKDAITAEIPAAKTIGGAEGLAEAGIDFHASLHRRCHQPCMPPLSRCADGEESTSACCSRPAPACAPCRCRAPTAPPR